MRKDEHLLAEMRKDESNKDKHRAVERWLMEYYESMSRTYNVTSYEMCHQGGEKFLCAHQYDNKHAERQRIVGEEYDRLGCIVRPPTTAQQRWFDDFGSAIPKIEIK